MANKPLNIVEVGDINGLDSYTIADISHIVWIVGAKGGEAMTTAGNSGTTNTGGGGGAYMQDSPTYNPGSVSTGGKGIVVIRYKYQ